MATTLHPASSSIISTELSAILTSAACYSITDRAFLSVTGSDAIRWLNGMVTNSIESLKPGEGNYNFLLNAQGRIQGDCTIYREPNDEQPSFLLETDASQLESIHKHLDRFIIMDDVELAPLELPGVGIIGAAAHRFITEASDLQDMGHSSESQLGEMRRVMIYGHKRIVLYPPSSGYEKLGIEQGEIWCSDRDDFVMLKRFFPENGAKEVSSESLEALRILSGTPLYGTDIRNTETARDLPQETAQTRALHFSKGCYLGQEIVERIHSRGAVHRTFTGFELTGTLPPTGTALTSDAKPVGELTSVASIPLPTGPIQLALGYIRREALDRALPLTYPGGTATTITLPYTGF